MFFKREVLQASSRDDGKLLAFARRRILMRLNELLALEPVVYHPDEVNALHKLRIAVRHLRYTLEIFKQDYGKGMEKYINDVIILQRVLGKIHD